MARDYESFTNEEKREIIQEVFGQEVPNYQWYCLTPGANVDLETIAKETNTPMDFGNMEIHRSRCGTNIGFRLRNAGKVATEIPQKDGTPAQLYQAVNEYMYPLDGWVDFLDGTITSGIPEHEATAKKYGMNFKLLTPETYTKDVIDDYKKSLEHSGKSESEVKEEIEGYTAAVTENMDQSMEFYNRFVREWRERHKAS